MLQHRCLLSKDVGVLRVDGMQWCNREIVVRSVSVVQ